MSQVVIASRLGDGRVVFLSQVADAGTVEWVALLGGAAVVDDDEEAAEILASAEADVSARHQVLDPYLIEVEEMDGELRPTKYREMIRCLGPTNRRDLGKQAEGARA